MADRTCSPSAHITITVTRNKQEYKYRLGGLLAVNIIVPCPRNVHAARCRAVHLKVPLNITMLF